MWKNRFKPLSVRFIVLLSFVIILWIWNWNEGHSDKSKKEIETLIWDFIWEGKVNQIKRDVCCLDIENGGMSMVNLDSYIDSRRIKFIYRIINNQLKIGMLLKNIG